MKIKLSYYDEESDTWVEHESKREYYGYSVHGATIPKDRWSRSNAVTIDLYIDQETGVVVNDIPKYERSLK